MGTPYSFGAVTATCTFWNRIFTLIRSQRNTEARKSTSDSALSHWKKKVHGEKREISVVHCVLFRAPSASLISQQAHFVMHLITGNIQPDMEKYTWVSASFTKL